MPTTTNFGWTTPADTDLVKDGAAAIRTFAGNVDTSLVDLKGGTTGQYLQKNSGTDLDYVWADVSAGGLTLIATATPSGASSLSFSTISASYTHLFLTWDSVFQSATGYWNIRLNGDTGTKYLWTAWCNQDGTAIMQKALTTEFGDARESGPIGETGTTNVFGTNNYGQFTVFNYSNTSVKKRVQWSSQSAITGTQRYPIISNGVFNETSAITSIDFLRSASQTITGTFYLYGVK
jgi:hypothetical protein